MHIEEEVIYNEWELKHIPPLNKITVPLLEAIVEYIGILPKTKMLPKQAIFNRFILVAARKEIAEAIKECATIGIIEVSSRHFKCIAEKPYFQFKSHLKSNFENHSNGKIIDKESNISVNELSLSEQEIYNSLTFDIEKQEFIKKAGKKRKKELSEKDDLSVRKLQERQRKEDIEFGVELPHDRQVEPEQEISNANKHDNEIVTKYLIITKAGLVYENILEISADGKYLVTRRVGTFSSPEKRWLPNSMQAAKQAIDNNIKLHLKIGQKVDIVESKKIN